ncbi:uncharacterized protein JCM6883_003466 [Sporobolomyces salmoneus]|uniref:uncharacterized protein n=1 Tax=Sporobolomyces salmoneus TaxID=183962 RepID=UPI00317B5A38
MASTDVHLQVATLKSLAPVLPRGSLRSYVGTPRPIGKAVLAGAFGIFVLGESGTTRSGAQEAEVPPEISRLFNSALFPPYTVPLEIKVVRPGSPPGLSMNEPHETGLIARAYNVTQEYPSCKRFYKVPGYATYKELDIAKGPYLLLDLISTYLEPWQGHLRYETRTPFERQAVLAILLHALLGFARLRPHFGIPAQRDDDGIIHLEALNSSEVRLVQQHAEFPKWVESLRKFVVDSQFRTDLAHLASLRLKDSRYWKDFRVPDEYGRESQVDVQKEVQHSLDQFSTFLQPLLAPSTSFTVSAHRTVPPITM